MAQVMDEQASRESMTVAILGQGSMGSAIGAELVRHGARVLTPLSGRSLASRDRAAAAGLVDASLAEVAAADIILSILPPAVAVEAAETLAPALISAAKPGVYVDLNAISPESVGEIAKVIGRTGAGFVDGSIIGLPPGVSGRRPPTLFVSGARAAKVEALSAHGLKISVLAGQPVGAASALKMCYGGITKGLIALGAAQLLAASRAGILDALVAELETSQPQLIAGFRKSIPDMLPKAARWVAEMEEIARFLGAERAESGLFSAVAGFYAAVAAQGEQGSAAATLTAGLAPKSQ